MLFNTVLLHVSFCIFEDTAVQHLQSTTKASQHYFSRPHKKTIRRKALTMPDVSAGNPCGECNEAGLFV